MQRAMLKWNGVPTKVITEGCWVEEGLSQYAKKDIVIVITGNPSVPELYEGFVNTIKSRLLPTEVPIWVVAHAGHIQPPSNLAFTMPSDSAWNEHYGLIAQVQHKTDFIKKYVPEDARLHLIGHSIGCWIILNMLKEDSIAKKVTKCYLLFPTIERMAASKNGWFFTTIVSHIIFLLTFLSWIFSCLPNSLQGCIFSVLGPFCGIPAKYTKSMLQILNPHSINRILKLADEEMRLVKERDDAIISKYSEKLWFYYGNCDGWTPVKYYNDMKSKHPYINAELCKHGYDHSFVFQYDKEMGKIVGDIINENIS
ncbi:UPF0554 protein C2orf43 like protein [Habropoda laboriosa]|uniref:Lipid droplet-associated hydrolase n=1 Tax=Habropoda laboriosa TaxID=597456 RepID=A0A0L7R2M2_9HYME|nr:PREDICTED: lipid droplet-associated hydrolase [Habropoda laboriosa]KOC65125.1 UPF0554 protein C2orf43 like protein [Habropoda laboriosa]